jgi:hypothetical protein
MYAIYVIIQAYIEPYIQIFIIRIGTSYDPLITSIYKNVHTGIYI